MIQFLSLEFQKIPAWIKNFTLVLACSLFLGLSSHLAIFLPFSPVPIVFQNFLSMLMAISLGSKKGSLVVLLFLIQGILGLPVFAGGAAGFAILIGPRGGYLLGYLIAAYIVGRMVERNQKKWISLLVGNGVIYFFGSLHLAQFVGIENVLAVGCFPFLIGDVLKLIGFLCFSSLTRIKNVFQFN